MVRGGCTQTNSSTPPDVQAKVIGKHLVPYDDPFGPNPLSRQAPWTSLLDSAIPTKGAG